MKTVLNVKTDREVKEDAQRIAGEMGIPLSIVVNAYLKDFIRTRTFSTTLEPQQRLKKEVGDAMVRAVKDYKKGANVSPAFSTAKDAMAWLTS